MRARRGRGEGTVFRRKDGTWCAAITAGYDEDGRRRRRYVYGATKAAVLEAITQLRAQALDGALGEPVRLTVAQFLRRWVDDVVRPSLRPKSAEYYCGALRYLLPRLGGVRLTALGPAHVQALLADLERAGGSPHVRRQVFVTLHRACQQALRWGLLRAHPCAAVARPRVPRREMCTLAPEQARAFLEAARGDRYFALYALMLGTGLRLGEALGLAWPDVDLDAGTVTVRRQLTAVTPGGRPTFSEPKTASARRTVDLPPLAVEALRAHQCRMQAEGHLLNAYLLVFVDRAGHSVRAENLRRRSFLPLLRAVGIPRIRLHDLRHSYATLNLAAGTHPRVVQQALGHADIAVTLQTYSHVLPGLQKEAALRLDRLLRGSEE
jgi:integrase